MSSMINIILLLLSNLAFLATAYQLITIEEKTSRDRLRFLKRFILDAKCREAASAYKIWLNALISRKVRVLTFIISPLLLAFSILMLTLQYCLIVMGVNFLFLPIIKLSILLMLFSLFSIDVSLLMLLFYYLKAWHVVGMRSLVQAYDECVDRHLENCL